MGEKIIGYQSLQQVESLPEERTLTYLEPRVIKLMIKLRRRSLSFSLPENGRNYRGNSYRVVLDRPFPKLEREPISQPEDRMEWDYEALARSPRIDSSRYRSWNWNNVVERIGDSTGPIHTGIPEEDPPRPLAEDRGLRDPRQAGFQWEPPHPGDGLVGVPDSTRDYGGMGYRLRDGTPHHREVVMADRCRLEVMVRASDAAEFTAIMHDTDRKDQWWLNWTGGVVSIDGETGAELPSESWPLPTKSPSKNEYVVLGENQAAYRMTVGLRGAARRGIPFAGHAGPGDEYSPVVFASDDVELCMVVASRNDYTPMIPFYETGIEPRSLWLVLRYYQTLARLREWAGRSEHQEIIMNKQIEFHPGPGETTEVTIALPGTPGCDFWLVFEPPAGGARLALYIEAGEVLRWQFYIENEDGEDPLPADELERLPLRREEGEGEL